jgi:hypothetical protein
MADDPLHLGDELGICVLECTGRWVDGRQDFRHVVWEVVFGFGVSERNELTYELVVGGLFAMEAGDVAKARIGVMVKLMKRLCEEGRC